jgi:N-acyl-phosphatidylethanolamine-hydrolysing phospholipase D
MLQKFLASFGKYRNNYTDSNPSMRSLLRWVLTRTAPPKAKPFPLTPNDPAALAKNRARPTLTWIGHSTFLVQLEGLNLITDPIFTERASPVYFAGPKRVTPVGLALDDLPPLDVVLISHNHHDHLNEHSVRAILARQPENPPLFVVPAGLGKWFRRRGFPRVAELDWWESVDSGAFQSLAGLKIHAVPVQHWSQRTALLVNHSRWLGFIVEGRGGKLFFPGDTGYSKDFADIRRRFGPMTVALLPIGAYEPEWFMKPMHTNPEEAARIHMDLGAKLSVAMHWGTFALTDEPFDEPPARFRKAMQDTGCPENAYWVMGHGETRGLENVWNGGDDARITNHIDEDLGA